MLERTHISTEELAEILNVQGNSIRRALCVKGHYLGIKPIKLPNGRLLWPVKDVDPLFDADSQ